MISPDISTAEFINIEVYDSLREEERPPGHHDLRKVPPPSGYTNASCRRRMRVLAAAD